MILFANLTRNPNVLQYALALAKGHSGHEVIGLAWTPETDPVLMRASLPASLGQEKPHEAQAPHPRADHPQAAHR
jgi:hypothetical protein